MKGSLFFIFILICFACNDFDGDSKNTGVRTDSSMVTNSNDPVFAGTDSIEVFFFADPANQKEFTRLFVADQASVNVMVQNLSKHPTSGRECPHNGKMYLFRKGEVFKTVYISTADSCRYFAYANNSNPQFVAINDSAYRLIHNLRLRAH